MEDQAEQHQKWWQRNKQLLVWSGIVIIVVFALFALLIYIFGWDWTGFNGGYSQITTTSTSHGTTIVTIKPPGKTMWDWLQLLIVPVALALIALLFNRATTRTEQKIAADRYKQDKEIASRHYHQDQQIAKQRYEQDQELTLDRQRENLLHVYLDRMSELLLDKQLRTSEPDAEVRNIARVRTITILFQLDTRRINYVFAFLREAGLVSSQPKSSIVTLSNADLDRINLSGVILSGTDLSGANLSGANLSGAIFFSIIYVPRAFGGTIGRPNNHADLSGADLRGANLSGAKVTDEQLAKAASLEGATMPGGSKHD
jgi:pentapeptide repeat protein